MVKRIILFVSLAVVVLWIVTDQLHLIRLCGEVSHTFCREVSYNIMIASIIILPVFIFSIITYFLREEVFRIWARFTVWWVPLSFVIVLFASSRQSANIVGLSDQAIFGFLSWGLYVLVSFIIVVWKYVATRRGASA